MTDLFLTGIPAFILAVLAAFVIALRSFKGMVDQKPKLDKKLKKVQAELDQIREGLPEKEVRVKVAGKACNDLKPRQTKLSRYYSELRKVEVAAEKSEMSEEAPPDPKEIQLKKR